MSSASVMLADQLPAGCQGGRKRLLAEGPKVLKVRARERAPHTGHVTRAAPCSGTFRT
jgi:hypothetical protein